MGQYFYLVNLDKREFVHAHEVGNGLKMGEQTGWKYSTEVIAAYLTAYPNYRHPLIGSWQGDRIGFAGDYGGSHGVLDMPIPDELLIHAEAIHDACDDGGWTNISAQCRDMMTALFGITYRDTGWFEIYEADGTKVSPFMRPDFVLTINR